MLQSFSCFSVLQFTAEGQTPAEVRRQFQAMDAEEIKTLFLDNLKITDADGENTESPTSQDW